MHFPEYVGVLHTPHSDNSSVRGDITFVTCFSSIIMTVCALGGVGRIKTVGPNAIALEINLILGHHGSQEQTAPAALDFYRARQSGRLTRNAVSADGRKVNRGRVLRE